MYDFIPKFLFVGQLHAAGCTEVRIVGLVNYLLLKVFMEEDLDEEHLHVLVCASITGCLKFSC